MRSARFALFLVALAILPGCVVRFVHVPDHVFTIRDEVVALQATGEAGKLKRNVKIPLRRLRMVAGDVERVYLLEYTDQPVKQVPHRREGNYIMADLVTGRTYLMMAAPDRVALNAYKVFCRLDSVIGARYLGRWADQICPLILCPAEPIFASELFKAVPQLKPFAKQLDFGDSQVGGWGSEAPTICARCTRYRATFTVADTPSMICTTPQAAPPAPEIAFVTERDGNSEIYVMNADGSNQTNLTANPAGDLWPRWSPDGQQIAFISTRDDGDSEIYVMNADGSAQTRLTSDPANDTKPSWSSDGQRIFFTSNRGGFPYQIYKLERDASRPTGWSSPILLPVKGAGYDFASSPNGQQIAFSAWDGGVANVGKTDIYTINVDGTGLKNLSKTPNDYEGDPDWFPSSRIAFDSSEGGGGIFTMNPADGSGRYQVTPSGLHPVWSPDGGTIAFKSHRDGNWEVYIVKADDGSGLTNLSQNPANDGAPLEDFLSWSPEGDRIVYSSDHNGNWEIHVVHVGSRTVDRLTNHSARDYFPQWRPQRN